MKYSLFLVPLLFLTSCNSNNNNNFIEVGERIHHDDFEYSVTNYTVSRFLKNGTDTLKANGMFYVVTFRVENRAGRVGHNWDNTIGYIIDEKGIKYENLPQVQQFLEKSHSFGYREKYNTPAGSSDSTFLAFDLPFTVTRPFLMVRGETLMGDVFDRGKFRKMMIRLFF
ncbi:MAG: hypothetical protein ABSA76_11680 [Bacteroidales bacterium]